MSDTNNSIKVVIEYYKYIDTDFKASAPIPVPKKFIRDNLIDDNTSIDLPEDIRITEIKFEINNSTLENLDEKNEILDKIISFCEKLKNKDNIEKKNIELNFQNTRLKYIQDKAFSVLLRKLNTPYNQFTFIFTFPECVEKFGNDVFNDGTKKNLINLELNIPVNVRWLGDRLFNVNSLTITGINDNKLILPKLIYLGEDIFKYLKILSSITKIDTPLLNIDNVNSLGLNVAGEKSRYVFMNEDFFNIYYKDTSEVKFTRLFEDFFKLNKDTEIANEIIIPENFTSTDEPKIEINNAEKELQTIQMSVNSSKIDLYPTKLNLITSLTAKGLTKIENSNPINLFTNLETLCLPKVNNIERDCFTNLNNLTHLELPRLESDDFLTSMYNGRINLVNLKLGLTKIEKTNPINLFTNLEKLCLPNVTTIEGDCFKEFIKLKRLEIPKIESVSENSFTETEKNSNQEKYIKLKDLDLSGIEREDADNLLKTEPLKSIKPDKKKNIIYINQCITKEGKKDGKYTTLNMNFDCGTPSTGQKYFAPGDILKTTITKIKIGPKVKIINDNLFEGFKALTTVDFIQAENLEKIGDDAFKDCIKLKKLDLKDAEKLETIGERAFQDCTSLNPDNIFLPYKITKTGDVTTIKTNIKESSTINNNDNNGNIDLGGGYRKPKLRSKKNNKKRRKNKTNKKARGGYKKLSKNTKKINKYGKMKIKKKFSKIKK